MSDVFRQFNQVNEVILYGSRASGSCHERSDIDLVIRNSHIDRHTLGYIKMELDNSDIPFLVDIQIFEKIKNPALIDQILKTGKVIYKK
ncbi:MAG: nucleotidyltransferase domain-containing protein [Saprospiraceae bacterium]|nr:nucleotidyltransferase domain-containing protein [Saprospiraceae bacterium]